MSQEKTSQDLARDKKEQEREPLKAALPRMDNATQIISVLADELNGLAYDLKLKGWPSQGERCQQLSDSAQEYLTEQGFPDKRKEPEQRGPSKQIRRFKPVVDVNSRRSTPQREVITHNPQGR